MATYYGKGSKDLIMSKIASLILAINGVKYVDYQRSYDSSISPEKFPGAFVNDVTENKQQILKDVVKNNFTIGVVGWVRATTVSGSMESTWTKLDTFIRAVEAAIRADPGLNSQVYKTEITRVETDSGTRYPVGLFVMIISVVYFSSY